MVDHHGLLQEKRSLNLRLIYGYYPEIVSSPSQEITLLKNLAGSYLYKDILSFGEVKKPIVLDGEYENILNVLEDEAFLKRFSSEGLSFVIYEKNKMMPIFFSKCGSCIGGTKYFMVLEKNIIKMITINQVAYDLVEPIPCEDE